MKQKQCRHMFICVNKKTEKKCCAAFDAENVFEYIKQYVASNREKINQNGRFKVVKTSCLGQCAAGPNIYMTPDNLWYTFSSLEDIDEIIESHVIRGMVVDRLLNKEISDE